MPTAEPPKRPVFPKSGGGASDAEKSTSDWIQEAADAYDRAQEALQDGNWAEYGECMDALENALNQLS